MPEQVLAAMPTSLPGSLALRPSTFYFSTPTASFIFFFNDDFWRISDLRKSCKNGMKNSHIAFTPFPERQHFTASAFLLSAFFS